MTPTLYTGLFAPHQAKSIAQAIDVTSNSVAFAESTVGSTGAVKGQKLVGMSSVSLPALALQLNAFDNMAGVISGLQACSTAWNGGGSYNVDKQRGDSWATGGMAMTLFNTVATPNVNNDQWAYCAKGGGTEANFSNAESYHSGGGQLPDGRR